MINLPVSQGQPRYQYLNTNWSYFQSQLSSMLETWLIFRPGCEKWYTDINLSVYLNKALQMQAIITKHLMVIKQ